MGKIKGNTTRKKEKQNKEGRSYIYMNYICYFINKTKNYFICCSDSRKRIIFFFIRLTIWILLQSSWSRHHINVTQDLAMRWGSTNQTPKGGLTELPCWHRLDRNITLHENEKGFHQQTPKRIQMEVVNPLKPFPIPWSVSTDCTENINKWCSSLWSAQSEF